MVGQAPTNTLTSGGEPIPGGGFGNSSIKGQIFRGFLTEFRDKGIEVAIDDAGSGYASLEAIAQHEREQAEHAPLG